MSKNDSKLLTKVSSLIPGQVPEFVESDHSLFVKFLKDYYQFLEAGRITLSTTINYVTLETTTVSYVINETDGTRIVTEIGEGTLGQFVEGETITGGTSNATATVLVDDTRNKYIYVHHNKSLLQERSSQVQPLVRLQLYQSIVQTLFRIFNNY